MRDLVYIHQNKCWTDSKKLAETFEKMHKDVLKKIRLVIEDMQDPEFIKRNFAPKEITTLRGALRGFFFTCQNWDAIPKTQSFYWYKGGGVENMSRNKT